MIAAIVVTAAVGIVAYHVGLVCAVYQIMDADDDERDRLWAAATGVRDKWHEIRDESRDMTGKGEDQ